LHGRYEIQGWTECEHKLAHDWMHGPPTNPNHPFGRADRQRNKSLCVPVRSKRM
jgi:hypothetical protein